MSPTVREARDAYFAANGFPADGGYAVRWVPLTFGPVTLYLYNSAARKRAVPIHDLHHILLDYATTPAGEAEVAAWELAAGTWPHWFAMLINLPALLYGTLFWPRRIWAAFVRGRRSSSLYVHGHPDALLGMTVEAARASVQPLARSPVLDMPVLALWLFASIVSVVGPLVALGYLVRSFVH